MTSLQDQETTDPHAGVDGFQKKRVLQLLICSLHVSVSEPAAEIRRIHPSVAAVIREL